MADEQAPTEVVDTPTPQEEAQPETTEDTVREDVTNSSEDSKKGDLGEALRQERELRRKYEEALTNPEFVYQQAKKLGLTEEEAQEQASQAVQQPQVDIASMVDRQVERRLDYQQAITEFPEMAKDPELQAWAAALVDSGKTHVEAAKIIQKRLGSTQAQAKAEGMTQARQEVSEKERAQTAPTNVPASNQASELDDLRKRMKSWDKKTQENALVEWLKIKNKKS